MRKKEENIICRPCSQRLTFFADDDDNHDDDHDDDHVVVVVVVDVNDDHKDVDDDDDDGHIVGVNDDDEYDDDDVSRLLLSEYLKVSCHDQFTVFTKCSRSKLFWKDCPSIWHIYLKSRKLNSTES